MPHLNKPNQFYLTRMHHIFLPCAAATIIFQIINNIREIDFFGATHWVWDYSLGFVKRGLVGQITEYIFGSTANTYSFISKASIILMISVIFAYLAFSYQIIKARPKLLSLAVVFSGLMLYPVIPSMIYDNGRFDQLNYIILIITCYIILNSNVLISIIAYEACCCLCIFVHEGFFLQQFPLMTVLFFSILVARHHLRLSAAVWLTGLATSLPMLAFVAVWLWGSAPVSQADWIAHWADQAAFIHVPPEIGDAIFVHFRTVKDNIFYTLQEIRNFKIIFAVLVVVSIAYLTYFICRFFIGNVPTNIKFFIIVAAFSPCVMFILGLDYLRWTSSLAFNVIISILFLICLEPFYETLTGARDSLKELTFPLPGVSSIILASVFYIFLLFPQSTGIVGVRPLPEGFRCTLGTAKVKETWPRNPDACFWSQANAPKY